MKFFDCDEDGSWCTGVLDSICLDHITRASCWKGFNCEMDGNGTFEQRFVR